jgi:NADH-quinone oxidoreductase subunit N
VLSTSDEEAMDIRNYSGLFWRRPILATVFSVVLLSLAGIPLTAGFMGKFLVLSAGVGNGDWLLVLVLVISSVIGLFYYLRFIFAMMKTDDSGGGSPAFAAFLSSRAATVGIALLVHLGASILWLGSFPAWLMIIIRRLM